MSNTNLVGARSPAGSSADVAPPSSGGSAVAGRLASVLESLGETAPREGGEHDAADDGVQSAQVLQRLGEQGEGIAGRLGKRNAGETGVDEH